jgi:hypothetical protein
MMRLIDIEAPCKIEIELDGEKCHATVTAPTIDAVPVVHAHLINPDPYGDCSNCGYLIDIRQEYNYCPNCGAKMREAGDNDGT